MIGLASMNAFRNGTGSFVNAVDVVQPPRSSNHATAVLVWPVSVTADRGLSDNATLRPPRFMICSPIAGTASSLALSPCTGDNWL